MEQFSLEKYLKNPTRKVVTRDGREVALFGSLSGNKDYPVKGMIEKNETVCTWTKTGVSYCNGKPQSDDLFFADEEEELTEFDYAVLSIISDHNSHKDSITEFAKRSSKKLLDLARKEFLKDLPKWKKITDETNLSLTLSNGDYYLPLEDLEKLPKE